MGIIEIVKGKPKIRMELVVAGVMGPSNNLEFFDNVNGGTFKWGGERRCQGRVTEGIKVTEESDEGLERRCSNLIVEGDRQIAIINLFVCELVDAGSGQDPTCI
jgi:hypothetical protein